MAITEVGNSVTTVGTGSGSESITLPGTEAEDDIVVVALVCDNNLDGSVPGGSGGAGGIGTTGYVEIYTASGQGNPGSVAGYKRMASTPDSSVSINQKSNRDIKAAVQTWRGIDSTTAIDNSFSNDTGTSGMPDPPSHTTSNDNAKRVIIGYLDDDAVTATAPSGFGDIVAGSLSGLDSCSIMIASKTEASAGALNPAAFGGSGTDDWRVNHFALRAAVVSGRIMGSLASYGGLAGPGGIAGIGGGLVG